MENNFKFNVNVSVEFSGRSQKILRWQCHRDVGLTLNLNFIKQFMFEQQRKMEFLAGQEVQVIS